MKTIILIGMVSLGFLNQNHAGNAKQQLFINLSDNKQFFEVILLETGPKSINNAIEVNYFDPSTVLPKTVKSLEQEILDDNLIVENISETKNAFLGQFNNAILQTIQEDTQITEAKNLGVYQSLDFEFIYKSLYSKDHLQNK